MDTSTSYLGRRLPHPFIAGASPLGWDLDMIKRLEDAGASAIVLPSLFEEQVTLARAGRIHGMDAEEFADRLGVYPAAHEYPFGPHEYAAHVSRVKDAVGIPVLGSLNGTSPGSWLTFAQVIQQAGADGLELNLYEVITNLGMPGTAVEHDFAKIVTTLKSTLTMPIAVKVSPFFTAFGNVARQLDAAGADALVLFNRFYQPDIDIETMAASPQVELSTSSELRLRLRWLAILFGRVRPALAVTGGVATPVDGIKALLAGADVIQLASALLRHGPAHLSAMRDGLIEWMERHEFVRLGEFRGRVSLERSADPAAFERANYIRTLQSWKRS